MDVTEALAIVMRLIMACEGLMLRPYLCPAGVPTIGYGCTHYLDGRPVRLSDPSITREHAVMLLRHLVLTTYMPGVRRLAAAVDTPGRLAALTDFAFNLGLARLRGSTLLRRVCAGRWDLVPTELRKWIFGGGKRLQGLVARRELEIQLI